jgi:hypothetical protein
MLAPGRVTPGLLHVVEHAVSLTMHMIEAEARHLTRAELRQHFTATAKLATNLVAALQLPATAGWLAYDADCTKAAWAILQAAPIIAARCTAEAAKIPKGKGRTQHVPAPGGLDARGMCALHSALLWRAAHRSEPGAHSGAVWQLCERIWLAAGGTPSVSDKPFASWRLALEEAIPRMTDHPSENYERWIVAADLTIALK